MLFDGRRAGACRIDPGPFPSPVIASRSQRWLAPAAAVLLAILALAPPTASAPPAPSGPVWDAATAKAALNLAERWFKARPSTCFTEWDAAARAALVEEAKKFGGVPEGIMIFLNDRMIDPQKEVVVRVGKQEVYGLRPVPDFYTILETLDARLDTRMVFDRRIEL